MPFFLAVSSGGWPSLASGVPAGASPPGDTSWLGALGTGDRRRAGLWPRSSSEQRQALEERGRAGLRGRGAGSDGQLAGDSGRTSSSSTPPAPSRRPGREAGHAPAPLQPRPGRAEDGLGDGAAHPDLRRAVGHAEGAAGEQPLHGPDQLLQLPAHPQAPGPGLRRLLPPRQGGGSARATPGSKGGTASTPWSTPTPTAAASSGRACTCSTWAGSRSSSTARWRGAVKAVAAHPQGGRLARASSSATRASRTCSPAPCPPWGSTWG